MRNIFDQYSQPENRVTHALVTALHEDCKLLRAFLKDIAKCLPPRKKQLIEICEQTYPGETETIEDATAKQGIPDAWITAGDDWCLVIENKVLSTAKAKQLIQHLTTAKRLGFADPKALVLTVKSPKGEMPQGTRVVEWRAVYQWLNDRSKKNPWAKRVAEFLEVMEGRMVDSKQFTAGTLTTFNGFPFHDDNPYTYLEAKRVLGLATEALRNRKDLKSKFGIDPDFRGHRAIKGRGGDNWIRLARSDKGP